MNHFFKEDILERNLIENCRMSRSIMILPEDLIRRGELPSSAYPRTPFIKKAIVSGGKPYTYMMSGVKKLWK